MLLSRILRRRRAPGGGELRRRADALERQAAKVEAKLKATGVDLTELEPVSDDVAAGLPMDDPRKLLWTARTMRHGAAEFRAAADRADEGRDPDLMSGERRPGP